MKVLLINPPLLPIDRYGKDLAELGPVTEPLGLAYIAAVLEQRGDTVEILDTIALNYRRDDIVNHLKGKHFDAVGVTMLTPMYLTGIEVIKLVKSLYNDIIAIVGGPHPTLMPIETLRENPEIDFAVVGEGEETIVELLNAVESGTSLSKIKGIAYREGDEVRLNEARPFIQDLDSIPLPARHLLPMILYTPTAHSYQRLPNYSIMTVWGCPFRCVYCSQFFGKKPRYPSTGRIIQEMKLLIDEYGAKEIKMEGDTFTANKNYVKKLCREIIKEGLHKKIKWHCSTHVNVVDKDLLELMAEAGCWEISYGVETGSQRLMDLIRKQTTLDRVREAFKMTKEVGIMIRAFFMLGLPTETREESLQTIAFAKELDPYWAQFTITTPYPMTELYELAKKDGTLKSFRWEDYQTWAGFADTDLVYTASGRSSDEIKDLQRKALRAFYFRPKILLRHLRLIKSKRLLKKYLAGGRTLLKSYVK